MFWLAGHHRCCCDYQLNPMVAAIRAVAVEADLQVLDNQVAH
jgi:hypothetical protein